MTRICTDYRISPVLPRFNQKEVTEKEKVRILYYNASSIYASNHGDIITDNVVKEHALA
ncbi:hypothetical protein [Paenibacillus macquariensis]|uniref:hypothetical protein n=1 Tax=Paenibacillus macquariensis TaxID=948756 RepID=UPI000AEFF6E1|nr:hypothetical protein [Paenibacillus macquariensis]MEC0090225.1 hypothetical protein [Paenibacillus macquariensis]